MIPAKSLEAPARRERVMRLDADFLERSARVKDYALLSLRREGEALVPAAGAEKVANAGGAYEDMFCAGGTVFARRSDNIVDTFPVRKSFSFGNVAVLGAAVYPPVHGQEEYYLCAHGYVYRIYGDTYEVLGEPSGGSCIAVHHERLFLAEGSKLCYSAPLAADKWLLTGEDTGEIDLSPEDGDILALCPYGGDLYVFRENGIFALRAEADDLNFRFERVEFGGRPLAKSICCTGGAIVFQTARGIARLSGNSCKLVRRPRMAEVLPESAAWEGRYYARAKHGGKDCIYVFDPDSGEEYLLDIPATGLAGDTEGVYFVHGMAVYRLTDSGFPASDGAGTLELTLDAGSGNGAVRYLSAVTVLGDGAFTAEFSSGGLTRTVPVTAGERTRVMQLLRAGTLQMSLKTTDTAARIRTVLLHFEEDAA